MLIRAARENATVFLCGHGGDEVLGGYRLSQDRFRLAILHRLSRLPLAGSWLGAPLGRFLHGDEPLVTRRRAFAEGPPEAAPAAARYLVHRPLPPEDLRLLFGGPLPGAARYLETVDRLYAGCSPQARDLDRMQELMLRTFLSENILSFGDATAMASSAELRMPFLDRDLVEFVLGLPPEARVGRWPGRANTKLVLRWWARGRLPESVIRRRKRGFQFGSLSALLRTDRLALRDRVLGSRAVRAALPGAETWLARPAERFRGPWEGTLWALLALGVWCEAVGVEAA
jgi:asparagine synthase (glutamine-hydrolysing)